MIRTIGQAVVWAALALWPLAAAAQDSGRWWWEAEVGVGQRAYRNSVGTAFTRNDQGELYLGGGLNGFIVHPAVARFRVGLDLAFTRQDFGARLDSSRAGFSGDMQLFSRGTYPVSLFYRHLLFDYSQPETDDPVSLLSRPDTGTRWGLHVLASHGPLRGARAGIEGGTLDFLDPTATREYSERQFLGWNRSGAKFRHNIRLDRRAKSYGLIDQAYDDYTLNIAEGGMLTPRTQWDLSVIGVHRQNLQPEAGLGFTSQNFRLANRMSWKLGQRETFDLYNNIGMFRAHEGTWNSGQGVRAFYRRQVGVHWEVAPNALFAIQSAGAFQSRTPQIGVDTTWNAGRGKLAVQLGGGVAYGLESRHAGEIKEDGTTTTLILRGSLAHGNPQGLQKEFEFSAARNEVIVDREPIPELPDFGLPGTFINTRNSYRARVTLRHRSGSGELNGWAEWSRRETGGTQAIASLSYDSFTGTFTFNNRRFNLQANAGQTLTGGALDDGQKVRFVGATGYWRIFRRMYLRGSYRMNFRDVILTPRLDGTQWEAAVGTQLGILFVEARIYEHYREVAGAPPQNNQGIAWSIKTRFAGWLPIVTGTGRRGEIR